MDAARGDNVDVVDFLLGVWHADVLAEDVMGRNVLHHVAEAGATLVIQHLGNRELDVNKLAGPSNSSPLHYAAKVGVALHAWTSCVFIVEIEARDLIFIKFQISVIFV